MRRTMCALAVAMLASAAQDARSWRQNIDHSEELMQQGRFVDAERTLETALSQASAFQPDPRPLAITYHDLGRLNQELRRSDRAVAAYQHALHLWEKIGAPARRSCLRTAVSLVAVYLENGALKPAERHHRMLIAPYLPELPPTDPDRARGTSQLASLEFLRGHFDRARAQYQRAAALWEAAAPHSMDYGLVLNNLALACDRAGRSAEAAAQIDHSRAVLEALVGSSHPLLIRALVNAANIRCHASSACDGAEPLYQRALASSEGYPENMLDVLTSYASMLRQTHRKSEAADLERRARWLRVSLSTSRQTVDVRELQGLQ